MRTVFFIPPLRQLSGGLANIYVVATHLHALGAEVAFKGPSQSTPGLAEAMSVGIPLLTWDDPLNAKDVWCIPESWPNAIAVAGRTGTRTLVYVQNWVYMLHTLPEGLQWNQLPVDFIEVSHPLAWFLDTVLGLKPGPLLPPSVPDCFFRSPQRPKNRVRVAWMPRKNKALAEQIQRVATSILNRQSSAPRIEWVEINKIPRHQVAEILSSCHIFLSTGFPEGFALPPLEAMASGCVPLGFAGFGGWEYMRQAKLRTINSACTPPFELPDDGIPCNGFYFSDGDTLQAGISLAKVICLAAENGLEWRNLSQQCQATASLYTERNQRDRVADIFLNSPSPIR